MEIVINSDDFGKWYHGHFDGAFESGLRGIKPHRDRTILKGPACGHLDCTPIVNVNESIRVLGAALAECKDCGIVKDSNGFKEIEATCACSDCHVPQEVL